MLLVGILQMARLVEWFFSNDWSFQVHATISLCCLIVGAILIGLKWSGYKEEIVSQTATITLFCLAISPTMLQVIRALW